VKNKNLLLGDDLKVSILRQRRKPLALLSIIVPVSLLVSFRLTGILSGPIAIAETITLETVKWESERPNALINLREKAQSFYDGDIAIDQSIGIHHYDPDDWGYGGSSRVSLTVNITSSVPVGYISNIRLNFLENYENARINFFGDHQLMNLGNLSITGFKDWARDVFVNLTGLNRPNKVYFWAPVHWVLRSQNNQTHLLDVVSETVYFNGTVYKKVVQPFLLKIGPDENNSFETAEEIHEGNYPKLFLGPPGGDIKDYYKIYLIQGNRIKVYVNGTSSPGKPDFGLYLYDPNRNLIVAKDSGLTYFEIIDVVANSTGFWFIEVRIFENLGFYSLTISLSDNR